MTLRNNTERPETITIGTNELLGTDPKAIAPAMKKLIAGQWKQGRHSCIMGQEGSREDSGGIG